MSKDKFQDKYQEIFQHIKEEKMEWDFEDFLNKAEGNSDKVQTSHEAPVIQIGSNINPSLQKWFWMAAGLVLLLSFGFLYRYNNQSTVEEQAKLVENQIRGQKNAFIEENNDHQEQVAVNHNADSISKAKKDSIFQDNQVAEKDYLEEILPKRGRMKKDRKPKYVYNSLNHKMSKDSTGYDDSYVIVNGKRITSEKEAIDVATYSFMKMRSGFNKTVASSQKNENLNNEY